MKKLLLRTTFLVGLAGPAFAQNSIYINDSGGTVTTLSIIQDDGTGGPGGSAYTTGGSATNTVSATNGGQMPINGPWNSITISQLGQAANTLKGALTSKTGSAGGNLSATYTTSASGGSNNHTLLIGQTSAPTIASVTIMVANTGAVANTIADTIDSTGTLTYKLGVSDYNDSITNTVSAGSGNVTLTEGDSSSGFSPANYEGIGSTSGSGGNTVTNLLTSAGGTVTVNQYVNGSANTLYNSVTTSGGAISLTQGGSATAGIVGSNNVVDNFVGNISPVSSFAQTLYVNGSGNSIYNTVEGAGNDTVNVSIGASAITSNNTVTVNVTGSTTAALNVDNGSQYTNLYYTSAAATSHATVTLNDVVGTNSAPGIVTLQQTAAAASAQATLTLDGQGAAPGSTLTVPAGIVTYPGGNPVSLAGVVAYQNSSGAVLNAIVTGSSSGGYTVSFKQ